MKRKIIKFVSAHNLTRKLLASYELNQSTQIHFYTILFD